MDTLKILGSKVILLFSMLFVFSNATFAELSGDGRIYFVEGFQITF